jgi:hypothetical protein
MAVQTANKVAKTYPNEYVCDMWSRSVIGSRDNKYSRDIHGHVAFQIHELDRRASC